GVWLGLETKVLEIEAYADSGELLERAVKFDAERPSSQRKQARLLLAVILKTYDENFSRAETLLKQGLAIHPADAYDAKLLYVLGRTYISWGKRDQAREALQEVVKSHADSPVAQKARETLV